MEEVVGAVKRCPASSLPLAAAACAPDALMELGTQLNAEVLHLTAVQSNKCLVLHWFAAARVQCRNVDVVEHARVWLRVQVVGKPVVTSHHSGSVVDCGCSFVVVRLVTWVTLYWTLVTGVAKTYFICLHRETICKIIQVCPPYSFPTTQTRWQELVPEAENSRRRALFLSEKDLRRKKI